MKKPILLLIITLFLNSCGDECKEYSDFSCKQIEKADYNVYFYYPSQKEVYLGQASGLTSCGNIARNFANSKRISNQNWGYICCMIAKGSCCCGKHR